MAIAALVVSSALLVGCEDDDSPMQAGNCTITVVNATPTVIHVAYQTQTWDVLWPTIDVSHEENKDIGPGEDADLSVHFDNQLGTSRIQVTKDDLQKNYDLVFGRQTLTVREDDFAGD